MEGRAPSSRTPRAVACQEPLPVLERDPPLSSLPLPRSLISVVSRLHLDSREEALANPVADGVPRDDEVLGDG
jgi:hypothetical protein